MGGVEAPRVGRESGRGGGKVKSTGPPASSEARGPHPRTDVLRAGVALLRGAPGYDSTPTPPSLSGLLYQSLRLTPPPHDPLSEKNGLQTRGAETD